DGRVKADHRVVLFQPIAWIGGIAEQLPEVLSPAVERCPAANKSPELPAKPAPYAAEDPPTPQEMLPFRGSKTLAKVRQGTTFLQVPLDLFLERLQHPRHRHQHRNALAADGADDLGRRERFLKDHRSTHELRQ